MARKRANGEGSYYQLQDRTWVYQVTVGKKADGSPQRKSFKGRTKAICKQRKEEWDIAQATIQERMEQERLEAENVEALAARPGYFPEADTLFSDAFMEWLKLYKSPPTRKPSTYASHLATYKTHFGPAFGEMSLYAITQDVIQEYYQKKQLSGGRLDNKKGGLSPKTIRNHHMILKDFFTYAEGKYKLHGNPTLCTTRPEVIQREMRVLSSSEMEIFIREVMKETQRIAILTDLFVGYRKGELLALEISDFDLERQTLRVTKNIQRVPTEALSLDNPNIKILNYDPSKKTHLIVQNTPKTRSSYRETSISGDLCELLVRHIFTMANSDWPNPNNLLFPSTTGTYIDPKSFDIRLRAVSKRCEIKNVNPHALRHSAASALIANHVDVVTVSKVLGHASPNTTGKFYSHLIEDAKAAATDTIADVLIRRKA